MTITYTQDQSTGEIYGYDDNPAQQALAAERIAAGHVQITSIPEEPAQTYIPQSVTRRQGRLALLDVNKLDDVEAIIAAITDPIQKRAAQIEYEADTWERSNQFLQAVWSLLGGTETELDSLFIDAASR